MNNLNFNNKPSYDELLKAYEQLKANNKKKISFKISTAGAVSILGLQRFPVTLYKDQWLQVIDHIQDLKEFIDANASKLASKN